jgi:hypothetical protein
VTAAPIALLVMDTVLTLTSHLLSKKSKTSGTLNRSQIPIMILQLKLAQTSIMKMLIGFFLLEDFSLTS